MTRETGLGHEQNLALGDQGRVSQINDRDRGPVGCNGRVDILAVHAQLRTRSVVSSLVTRDIHWLGCLVLAVLLDAPLDRLLAGLVFAESSNLCYCLFDSRQLGGRGGFNFFALGQTRLCSIRTNGLPWLIDTGHHKASQQKNSQKNKAKKSGPFAVVIEIFVAHYLPTTLASECSLT